MLFLAFNRDIVNAARDKMPPNVKVATSHSLAFQAVARGWRRDKLQRGPTPLALRDAGVVRTFEQARHIREALNDWCMSDAQELKSWARVWYAGRAQEIAVAGLDEREFVEALARLWRLVSDPEEPIGMHDVYFKLWQLSGPRLDADVVLVDEAQDSNSALLDVLLRQSAQRVIVGDPHQGIYGFRGARDIMRGIEGRLHLTHSFRFSGPIARVASALLEIFKGETKQVTGAAPWASRLIAPGLKPGPGPGPGTTAWIYRTNAGVFEAASEMMRGAPSLKLNVNVADAALDEILDAFLVYDGRGAEAKNPLMRRFPDFLKLQDYAEQSGDRELIARCKLVERFRGAIPRLVDRIRRTRDPAADVTITTAHRGKGLEWDHVVLGDDFPALMNTNAPAARPWAADDEDVLPEEEANLWYVVATRAKASLTLNRDMQDFVGWYSRTRARARRW
jgi:F-box protein 18 (helicase)